MILWIDAQLPPSLAAWIEENFSINSVAVRDLGLRDASDEVIFQAARYLNVVVVTKDADFPEMLLQSGPPPKIIWLTCSNTSNSRLKQILSKHLHHAVKLLAEGESLVEILDE
ncbi:MAG: DUF5615 family PIN-like protein [Magnetococcales bacterium]|nr:DUF5615 family PIN-like protein [Magnetococcales bacterium]